MKIKEKKIESCPLRGGREVKVKFGGQSYFFLCSSIDTPPKTWDNLIISKWQLKVFFTWTQIDNHEQPADDGERLEEVIFQEVAQWFVRWNGPPGVVVKIQDG